MNIIKRTKRINEILFNICNTAADNPKLFADNDFESQRLQTVCRANHELVINVLLMVILGGVFFNLLAGLFKFIIELGRR